MDRPPKDDKWHLINGLYMTVTSTIADHVGTITLAEPDSGNPLNLSTARSLLQAAEDFASNTTVRSVLLTGSGRFFCVGGDLKTIAESGHKLDAYLKDLTDALHRAIAIFLRMDKPLVVAVNGPAAGGGLGLALVGDIVLASPSAHFTMAYTGIGFSPDCGTSWLLPRLIGWRRASEMTLWNRRLTSAEAVDWGLITGVVDSDLLAEANQIARQLAKGPVKALAASRALLLSSYELEPEIQMESEAKQLRAQATGPEGREGVAAFLEKRSPQFTG